jgi:YebC/PmpR family DNA-binding regulatory protein
MPTYTKQRLPTSLQSFCDITGDMAGHSKWAKVKHKKALTDARKSNLFSKLVRFIQVEARKARGDRGAPGLRAAIEKARAANMPSDNIDRAIAKAAQSGESEAVTYEAYGPGGAALVIDGYTDNRNRTAQEIKHLLSKNGGALANPGAALWAFSKNTEGKLEPTAPLELGEEELEKLAQLVEELEEHDDVSEVYTNAA